MSDLILKTKEDINHFLTGCAFLGTGGGGEVSVGRDTLYKGALRPKRMKY